MVQGFAMPCVSFPVMNEAPFSGGIMTSVRVRDTSDCAKENDGFLLGSGVARGKRGSGCGGNSP